MVKVEELVSTHSRPKAAGTTRRGRRFTMTVSTHSRPKAAGNFFGEHGRGAYVSTHSRPKAAGRVIFGRIALVRFQHTAARRRLDGSSRRLSPLRVCFNTQPPEGGWGVQKNGSTPPQVSTHSRPKAAGNVDELCFLAKEKFQHTAARRRLGRSSLQRFATMIVSTHSRPKAAGGAKGESISKQYLFQHTAARRRLGVNLYA